MRIATWNVNSLRVRLPQVLEWLAAHAPDILALQETKVTDDAFPVDELRAAGYEAVFSGEKSYNGVAVLTRAPAEDVTFGIDPSDPQRRCLAVTVQGVHLVNAYVPNGSEVGSEKYLYKLRWLEHFERYLDEARARHERVAVVGDFNIAPEDQDVHDPEAWLGSVLVSPAERAAFRRLTGLGFEDLLRRFPREDRCFTWWDYRLGAFRRNLGLRIDHILVTPALARRCRDCRVDRVPRAAPRPSDHAPVVADFDVGQDENPQTVLSNDPRP